jgi:hypothetical protein
MMSAVATVAVPHAQGTSRPQLVVHRAAADLAAEKLLIEGEKVTASRWMPPAASM